VPQVQIAVRLSNDHNSNGELRSPACIDILHRGFLLAEKRVFVLIAIAQCADTQSVLAAKPHSVELSLELSLELVAPNTL
jgi:hypothetical protein